jgi:hypothetical protein
MEYMKLDKEWLMKSEFGIKMCVHIEVMDEALEKRHMCREGSEEWLKNEMALMRNMAAWEMAQAALWTMYGIHYNFTRTEGYYGICNDDESDWLYKVERDGLKQREGSNGAT